MMLAGLLASLGAGAALPETVAARLKAAKLPESALAAVVLPLDGGPARLEHHADVAVNPASTLKLISTLAALETLGPTYQWRTGLYTDGQIENGQLHGNLYLQGSGDPKLTFERVWLLLRDLRAQGVRRVAGDLVLDRNAFRLPPEEAVGQFDEQPERAYNVLPDPLLMNFKAVRFEMESDGNAMTVRVEPPLEGLTADSRMKLVSGDCGSWNQGWARPEIRSEALGQVSVTLQGRFPRQCRAARYLGVLEAPDFASRLVRGLWRELGGEITGGTREAAVPAGARKLAETASPPLAELVRDINKLSNNTMARSVFMTLGSDYQHNHTEAVALDSQQAAALAVRDWAASHGQTFAELVLDNGAGLSRIARVTPRHLATVLQWGYRSAFAPEYTASLPIVGLDGTMRKRLTGSPLAGTARVKTGTLEDVKAVAGYVYDPAGRTWLVVGIVNHKHAEVAQPALDALLDWAGQASPP